MFIPSSEYQRIVEVMPISCVDLLITFEGKCLLLRRSNDPAKGELWFPGGRVRKLESFQDAAIRISMEETNLNCDFVKVVSVEETIFSKKQEMLTDVHTINVCCEMVVSDITHLKIDDYHSDYVWIDSLDKFYHEAVNHPLSFLGFKHKVS